MQINHPPYRLGIEGLSGTGKTTLLSRSLESPRMAATCRFVFDHVGALAARLRRPAAFTLDSLKAQIGGGWVVFNPSKMFREDVTALDWFAKFALAASGALPGRKFFVVDELQDLAGDSASPNLLLVFNRGRNVGLDVAYVCQSFGEVHRSLAKQTTEAVTFFTTCEAAHYRLKKWGFNVPSVMKLPRGSWQARNLLTGGAAAGRVF